jgi:hypothetical protein
VTGRRAPKERGRAAPGRWRAGGPGGPEGGHRPPGRPAIAATFSVDAVDDLGDRVCAAVHRSPRGAITAANAAGLAGPARNVGAT